MKVTVIGTGYVGLVTGACLADAGNTVFCLDVDEKKIARLNAGEIPIFEPGLEAVVKRNEAAGRLEFSTDVAASVAHGEIQIIAVGTPPSEDGSADMQHVIAAARSVGRLMEGYKVVVTKSTVPVGTADKVKQAIIEEQKKSGRLSKSFLDFTVVSNPEFLKEGAAVEDFMRPDRIIVGSEDPRAITLLRQLYAPFQRNRERIIVMGVRSAELTKYAANAMLATRISFMNDVAALCEKVGADVDLVRKGLGADRRIGYPFLFPGVGYGGSCFPKDVKALVATAQEHGLEFDLLRAVEKTNARQKQLLVEKAKAHFGSLQGRAFALWGLAFKPKTDDLREAPSLEIIEGLLAAGAKVTVFDPVAMENAKRVLGTRVNFVERPYDALGGVDALFVVTEWNEFRHPDFERMKSLMKSPVVFDGRNVYSPGKMRELGFTWFGVGRK